MFLYFCFLLLSGKKPFFLTVYLFIDACTDFVISWSKHNDKRKQKPTKTKLARPLLVICASFKIANDFYNKSQILSVSLPISRWKQKRDRRSSTDFVPSSPVGCALCSFIVRRRIKTTKAKQEKLVSQQRRRRRRQKLLTWHRGRRCYQQRKNSQSGEGENLKTTFSLFIIFISVL